MSELAKMRKKRRRVGEQGGRERKKKQEEKKKKGPIEGMEENRSNAKLPWLSVSHCV